jgi:hypothetical protein
VLSTSKVVAGGLAAATTAALGSYFGVLGTVGGAAATSIVSAVSSELYQRSLARTANRLRPRAGGDPARADRQPGAVAPPRRRSILPATVVGSLLIFALGIAVVSGVEYARGAPLSGGSGGTSIGDVLHGSLPPVVGDVLGSNSGETDNNRDTDNSGADTHRHQRPGLVGGLLSGL